MITSGGMEEILYFYACDSVSIQGGTFSSGSTANDTISGVSVEQGRRARITQINEHTWGYEVVDKSEIPEAEITGTNHTYENDILTLTEGADVVVSSSDTVGTQIQVEAGAEASWSLNGITMLGSNSCIRVDRSATLTLNLSNTNNLYTFHMTQATISDAGMLTMDGSGTLNTGCIGEQHAAVIGGDAGDNGGNIVVDGGILQIDGAGD